MVERQLAEEGLTKRDLGREKFEARVWEWKEKYGGRIVEQMKRAGVSCDWPRERFTLDPGLSRAVREAFVRLYEKGLIYRAKYIVNWCPRCQTALSRSRSRARGDAGASLAHRLSGERERREAGGRDHAAGDDAGRYRGRDQSERSARGGAASARRCGCR